MNLFKSIAISFLLAAFLLTASAVNAEEGGSKAEGGGKDLVVKMDAIVVNLLGPTQQYIQVVMFLKLATPEVGERVKLYMPVIRHKMILLLTTKTAIQLEETAGKQKLVLESKGAVNKAIELTEKEGVTDVLFDSFIIQ
jgi:flagellar FliL protein